MILSIIINNNNNKFIVQVISNIKQDIRYYSLYRISVLVLFSVTIIHFIGGILYVDELFNIAVKHVGQVTDRAPHQSLSPGYRFAILVMFLSCR